MRAASAALITVHLGCGPSEAVVFQLFVARAQVEHRLALAEARQLVREEQMKQERQQAPSKYGPGDFPTHPPEPR